MSKQLLIETHTIKISPSQLNENINKENGNLLVEGILATAEVKNGNGRYYAKELWNREMDKYKDLIEQRRSMGELDHPESTVINLKNVIKMKMKRLTKYTIFVYNHKLKNVSKNKSDPRGVYY